MSTENNSNPGVHSGSIKVHVIVMPKRSVLDPQGVAVRNAVREAGVAGLQGVRVGKFLELEFEAEPDPVKLDEVCRDLLSNPVIEDYVIERFAGLKV
jgi:phosphoribosylformylglycinamidine synthase subunit PurS